MLVPLLSRRYPAAARNPALHHRHSETLSSPRCNMLSVSTDSTALLTHRRLAVAHSQKQKNKRTHKQRDIVKLKHENTSEGTRTQTMQTQCWKTKREKCAPHSLARRKTTAPSCARGCTEPAPKSAVDPAPSRQSGPKLRRTWRRTHTFVI